MEAILNSAQMKEADLNTINNFFVPSIVLMERAAKSVFDEIILNNLAHDNVLIICGSGNNGGDGFAVARFFAENNIIPDILFVGNINKMSAETCLQYKSCKAYKCNFVDGYESVSFEKYEIIIDAMFGVGLNRNLEQPYLDIIHNINYCKSERCKVIAVDIPSGISADNGKVMGDAVKADYTISFAFKKIGHVLYPGAEYCGNLINKDIGINVKDFISNNEINCFAHDEKDFPCIFRKSYSNKSTYGKTLIIAGSELIGGCAVLSAKACFATGAGMVKVFTHAVNRDLVLSSIPEVMVDTYDESIDYDKLNKSIEWSDVIAIGPGISTNETGINLLDYVLYNSDKPLVIDADAITLLKNHLSKIDFNNRKVIITPHIGELSRLIDCDKKDITDNLIYKCIDTAGLIGCICVLKDTRTVISDSKNVYINLTGNSGMAVAGSGDVLTGIISGLLAQGLSAIDAASLGVYIHGYAGDISADILGKSCMMPSDIIINVRKFFE